MLMHWLQESKLTITSSNISRQHQERCSCTNATAKNQWTFCPVGRIKVIHCTGPLKWILPKKLDEEFIPKGAFTTVFGKFQFLWLPFGVTQIFICLIYDLFGHNRATTQGQGHRCMAYLVNYSQQHSKSN